MRLVPVVATLSAAMILILAAGTVRADGPWEGSWRTYWRDSDALMFLTQEGDRVTGRYRPGDGRIEAEVEGDRLRGRWIEPEREGGFVFALADDGQSFVGRFDNGEYWNGERIRGSAFSPTPFTKSDTPRATLRTVIVAMNATAAGDSGAAIIWEPLITYVGPETDERDRADRRRLLGALVGHSTFRILDAPRTGEDGRASFEIGPAGVDWQFELQFVEAQPDRWLIEVPTMETLQRLRDAALEAAGHADLAAWREARLESPRGTMHDFLVGTANWDEDGDERALGTMDLSHLPEQLRRVEGVLAADYLKQVIDRVGYVIWQEIPDDPERATPYVHYEHAAGEVAIAPVRSEDGEVRWLFPSETIEALPDVYEAMANLPLATGLEPPEPLSEYFRLRDWVKSISPALLRRDFVLENWQWVGIAGTLVVSLVLAWLAGLLLSTIARRLVAGVDAPMEARVAARRGFVWPARIVVLGCGLLVAVGEFGLRTDVAAILGGLAALALVAAATTFAYALTGVAGGWFYGRAAHTPGYVDEVVASLGTGLAKILVVIAGLIATAEVLGLPYEGVIAGLGIGGLAIAIAARDTVSNFIGAAILLADRPFKRDDLVEAAGYMATVENVGLRSTRLRTFDDSLLVVPNSQLADGIVNNWGRRRSRRTVLLISVTYDTPRSRIDDFVERLREVYFAQPSADPTLYLGLKGFGPSSIDIELWGHFRVPSYDDHVAAQHRLIGDIVDLAREMEVRFALPARTVHVADAAKVAARRTLVPSSGEVT